MSIISNTTNRLIFEILASRITSIDFVEANLNPLVLFFSHDSPIIYPFILHSENSGVIPILDAISVGQTSNQTPVIRNISFGQNSNLSRLMYTDSITGNIQERNINVYFDVDDILKTVNFLTSIITSVNDALTFNLASSADLIKIFIERTVASENSRSDVYGYINPRFPYDIWEAVSIQNAIFTPRVDKNGINAIDANFQIRRENLYDFEAIYDVSKQQEEETNS